MSGITGAIGPELYSGGVGATLGGFSKYGLFKGNTSINLNEGMSSLVAEREAFVIEFYKQHGFGIESTRAHMQGIDFGHPVEAVTLPSGSQVVQFTLPTQGVGNYFAPVGTSGNTLGIYTSGRAMTLFEASQDITVLKSTAAPMVDTYSMAQYGWKIETMGGSTQYFSPVTTSLVSK